uniref:Hyaluronidase n=1 Tax=Photinus pyralis TaxID=7054 RepID=A0A1Y1K7I2_PHOPY
MFFKVLVLLFYTALAQDSHARNVKVNPFKTFWNMPTFQCAGHKLGFEKLGEKYNILQNKNDVFQGDQMTILYHPGSFPEIKSDGNLTNGGVPQEANLTEHLQLFEETFNRSIPDVHFAGMGIIDFEHWRPVYDQNFGALNKYRQLSEKIEKKRHPSWSTAQIKAEARRRFELHGRKFMESSILLAQRLRPNATWGYYGFPHCFNHQMQDTCGAHLEAQNDNTNWLFSASDTLNPSLYVYGEGKATQDQWKDWLKGRVKEAQRVRDGVKDEKRRTVVPYYTLLDPSNNEFLSKETIVNSISTLRELKIDGWIIWASSSHVNSRQKCEDLYKFIDTVFGPALIR